MSNARIRLAAAPGLWLLATLALLGCEGGGSSGACASDTDCSAGRICRRGACSPSPGACNDRDADGYFSGPGCADDLKIDCDDSRADVHPDLTEVCGDLLDQNCAAGADEGCACPSEGSSRDCGAGRCAGVQTCMPTGWGECSPTVTPVREECGTDGSGDGVDDDCNGEVDDGCVAFDAGGNLGEGSTCALDAECVSGQCECVDFDCTSRVCAAADCVCGYGTSGSCTDAITAGADPEDCFGGASCAGIGNCTP